MVFSTSLVFGAFLALISSSPAAAHPASPLQLAVIKAQFENAKLVPDVVPQFDPVSTFVLNFNSSLQKTSVGQAVNKGDITEAPELIIRGTAAAEATANGPFNVTTIKYTVLGVDAGVPGSNSSKGYNLHYLQNDLVYGVNSDHSVTLNVTTSPVIPYAAPNPALNSGPHRYTFLVYAQASNFTAPSTPKANSGVQLFNFTDYVRAAGLGEPLGGTYFTVEEGTANVTVAPTTAVDSTTLPEYTPTSASGTSGSPSPTQSPNAAVHLKAGLGGVLGALAALFLGL